MSSLHSRFGAIVYALVVVMVLGLSSSGCGGGGSSGGGGAPVASPTPAQTVSLQSSLQSNLQSVQFDSQFQASTGEIFLTSVTQPPVAGVTTQSVTVSGSDLHIEVNNSVFQSGGATTYPIKPGDTVRVFSKSDPSKTTQPYTH